MTSDLFGSINSFFKFSDYVGVLSLFFWGVAIGAIFRKYIPLKPEIDKKINSIHDDVKILTAMIKKFNESTERLSESINKLSDRVSHLEGCFKSFAKIR